MGGSGRARLAAPKAARTGLLLVSFYLAAPMLHDNALAKAAHKPAAVRVYKAPSLEVFNSKLVQMQNRLYSLSEQIIQSRSAVWRVVDGVDSCNDDLKNDSRQLGRVIGQLDSLTTRLMADIRLLDNLAIQNNPSPTIGAWRELLAEETTLGNLQKRHSQLEAERAAIMGQLAAHQVVRQVAGEQNPKPAGPLTQARTP